MLDLARRYTPPLEMAALLDAADAASRSGSGAQRCVLVRLTDGRIKIVQAPGEDAVALIDGIVRRHGPVSAAYYVEFSETSWPGTWVSDLIHRRVWRRSRLGWAPDEPFDQPRAAGLSRNAAIFAASLGMSTGALPKVDTIFTSPGAFS